MNVYTLLAEFLLVSDLNVRDYFLFGSLVVYASPQSSALLNPTFFSHFCYRIEKKNQKLGMPKSSMSV